MISVIISRNIVFCVITVLALSAFAAEESSVYDRIKPLLGTDEALEFVQRLSTGDLLLLGDQAWREQDPRGITPGLVSELYIRWIEQVPVEEIYLPIIRNSEKKWNPYWSGCVAYTLSNVIKEIPDSFSPKEMIRHLETVAESAKNNDLPSGARKFFLMNTSSVVQSAANVFSATNTNETFEKELDRACARIIRDLADTVRSTRVDTDEEKGLYNTYLYELVKYYKLLLPTESSSPVSNFTSFPFSRQQSEAIVPTFLVIMKEDDSLYKKNHTFQSVVNQLHKPDSIDPGFINSLETNARFQDPESKDTIRLLKEMYEKELKR